MLNISSLDLRLGTEFIQQPNDPLLKDIIIDPRARDLAKHIVQRGKLTTIEIGESIIIYPHTSILTQTLELIRIPFDLIGFTFGKSYLNRIGLRITSGVISSGFEGRLTFNIENTNDSPVRLYSGLVIINLVFAFIEPLPKLRSKYSPSSGIKTEVSYSNEEIIETKNKIIEQENKLQIDKKQIANIKLLLDEAVNAKVPTKGKKLEELCVLIFQNIPGIEINKVNANLKAEEIDIILNNNIDFGFWRFLGSPIVVECKNWSSKVGTSEISILAEKMKTLSPDIKTGMLISPKGITGNSNKDATLKVRDKRREGLNIIVLDMNSLQRIASGENASKVIEKGYNELFRI